MKLGNCTIKTVLSPMFQQNSFVVWREGNRAALIVDPGFEVDGLFDLLATESLEPAAILNTHGHADHIAGNRAVKERFPDCPLLIGRNEAHFLSDPDANLSGPFGVPLTSPPADQLVDEGDHLELAGIAFRVREIPGHSPGSVVFIAENDPPFVLSGDVVFAGGVGRFDFPGSDGRQLFDGIRAKLFTLPDNTVLFPGHGPPTTVGQERRTNPFVGEGVSFDFSR